METSSSRLMNTFTAKCKKSVAVKDKDNGDYMAFVDGKAYESINPEIWPPDLTVRLALVDEKGEPHFMDWGWFYEHFIKL